MRGSTMYNAMKRAVPFFVLTIGVLLILRGMNLNIPYVSPALSTSQHVIPCP